MTAHCQTECLGCIVAQVVARVTPGVPVVCREADCGAELLYTPQLTTSPVPVSSPVEPPPRKRVARRSVRNALVHSHTESGALRLVQAFVADVLDWTRARERVDRVAYGGESQFESVVRVLRAGIIGSGNSGTKGVGTTQGTPRMAKGDSLTDALYATLERCDQATVDAVVRDGRGVQLAPVTVGNVTVQWSLESRVGFALASDQQRAAWAAKVLSRDSSGPRVGSAEIGEQALLHAARAWFGAKARGE